MIEPMLLYGFEICGFENIDVIEEIHFKFYKRILGFRNTVPNYMVYGERGRFPLQIRVKIRIISFWARVVQNESKL